jgi:hypothetical protein
MALETTRAPARTPLEGGEFMRKSLVHALGIGAISAAMIAALSPAAMAAPNAAKKTTECTDTLAPGTYHKVIVPEDAVCIISEGPVNIHGGLTVMPGATFVLGSEDNPTDMGTISGSVEAFDPMNLQIHFATINGGLFSTGGSGPDGGPFGITWTTIEDNEIQGSVVIQGYDGFWMGFIRNEVYGSTNLNDNTVVDTDGNEYVTNEIHGNLNCSGDDPAPQLGDSGGEPNDVTGRKTGQCVNV